MFSVLLVFCVGYAAGQTCQQAGSVCYRVTSQPVGVVGGQCCDSCRPYLPNGGNTWDGTTDWFCQYANGGTEGQSCSTFTGACATGLTCINSVCSSSTTTSSDTTTTTTTTTTGTETTTTTATTTTTTTATTTVACT